MKKKTNAAASLVTLTILLFVVVPVLSYLICMAGMGLYVRLRGETMDMALFFEAMHQKSGASYLTIHGTPLLLAFIVISAKYKNIMRWRGMLNFGAVDGTGTIFFGLMLISTAIMNLAVVPEEWGIEATVMLVFCGPLMEELFFRHVLITELREKTRLKIVTIIMLQTVVWLLPHFPATLSTALQLFVFGVIYGCLYLYSRSIGYVFILHAFGNFPLTQYLSVPFITSHAALFYWGGFGGNIVFLALFVLHARRHFPPPSRGEVVTPAQASGEAEGSPLYPAAQ